MHWMARSRNTGKIARSAIAGLVLIRGNRSEDAFLYLTEISSPKNITVQSKGNEVVPLVIGKDTLSPPTVQYSSLDGGDVYGVPNGVANISKVNPVLEPTKYGLDFWESINGELVTVKKPVAIGRPNRFGDTWVAGDWKVSGRNQHGGLTTTDKGMPRCTEAVGL